MAHSIRNAIIYVIIEPKFWHGYSKNPIILMFNFLIYSQIWVLLWMISNLSMVTSQNGKKNPIHITLNKRFFFFQSCFWSWYGFMSFLACTKNISFIFFSKSRLNFTYIINEIESDLMKNLYNHEILFQNCKQCFFFPNLWGTRWGCNHPKRNLAKFDHTLESTPKKVLE
jgi:hypothetical protein